MQSLQEICTLGSITKTGQMYTMELVNLLDENLNLGTYFDKLVTKSSSLWGKELIFPPEDISQQRKFKSCTQIITPTTLYTFKGIQQVSKVHKMKK